MSFTNTTLGCAVHPFDSLPMACKYCAVNAGFISTDMTMNEGTSDLLTSVYPEMPNESIEISTENNDYGGRSSSMRVLLQEFQPIVRPQEPWYPPLSTVRDWKPAYEDYPEHLALDREEQDRDNPIFNYAERFALDPGKQIPKDPFFKKRPALRKEKRRRFHAAERRRMVIDNVATAESSTSETLEPTAFTDINLAEGERFDHEDTVALEVPDDYEPFPKQSQKNLTARKQNGRQNTRSSIKEVTFPNLVKTQAPEPRKRARIEIEPSDSELSDIEGESKYSEAENPRKRVQQSIELAVSERVTQSQTIQIESSDSELSDIDSDNEYKAETPQMHVNESAVSTSRRATRSQTSQVEYIFEPVVIEAPKAKKQQHRRIIPPRGRSSARKPSGSVLCQCSLGKSGKSTVPSRLKQTLEEEIQAIVAATEKYFRSSSVAPNQRVTRSSA